MALENKDNILQVFQTRARQLMYEYESVRKQRNELVKTVEQKELEIKNQELYRKDNELNIVKESSVPKDQYINLREELTKRDNRIKRLEELNEFFNELQQESNAFTTQDNTPPFRLDKK